MKLHMNLGKDSYDIILERGSLHRLHEHVNLHRKVMIITDDGVPTSYASVIKKQCEEAYVHVIPQGESSKCLAMFQVLCEDLLEKHFSRKDLIIALGGGVVGDLSGYVAASYMRGIDFIQVPTTTLSQIDSSIGGKVAIDLNQVKNIIGAFYQPKLVCIDPDTLSTLPHRHYINGLIEALKAGLIYDPSLFSLFEHGDVHSDIEQIIEKALQVKKAVVEKDEKELGLRKILNFGHTIGHAIESSYHLSELYHGECVAIGMLFFIKDEDVKQRVRHVYEKLGIRESVPYNPEQILSIMKNDKKANAENVDVITVSACGKAEIETMGFEALESIIRGDL